MGSETVTPRRIIATAIAAALLLAAAATRPARAQTAASAPGAWPDDFTSRVEALALLQTLNADLLSHDSATLTLDRWCASHKLAVPARVVAQRVREAEKVPTAAQRQLLHVGEQERVGYRHVRLACGDRVLSEADNWYVPGRLTPEMNQTLDTSDAAFGRVVQPLHFQRHTLSATLLWSPLPDGWEMTPGATTASAHTAAANSGSGSATLRVPPEVLQHHALLTLPDGTPISEVIETYTSAVLAFPSPARPQAPTPHD
jgi:chorismate-pyruvate lyase